MNTMWAQNKLEKKKNNGTNKTEIKQLKNSIN